MSYIPYPIIYHNDEFVLLIKEKLLENLLIAKQRYLEQLMHTENVTNGVKEFFDDLMKILILNGETMKANNLNKMKELINTSVDNVISCLGIFLNEMDWLCENIENRDPGAMKMWWDLADHATIYEIFFQNMVSLFRMAFSLGMEISDQYLQAL